MRWFALEVRDPALDEVITITHGGKNRGDAKRQYLATHYWMEVLRVWEI